MAFPSAVAEQLRAMGGLSETHAPVHRPTTLAELRGLFENAGARSYSLIGARHSFGPHFFPATDGQGIDLTSLPNGVTQLEDADPEHRWVRASGSMTFEALVSAVPGYLPRHPPTSDLITLGGALAGCTHDSIGYFADHVRRFTLLTPDGRLHDCRPDAPGLEGELFRLVPGSFGLLGLIVDLELRLYAAPNSRAVQISVQRGTFDGDPSFERLSEVAQRPQTHGAGVYLFGVRGPTVLVEGRIVEASTLVGVPPLPLTDDDLTRNAWLQGLASVSARVTNWFSYRTLADGRRFQARLYGHAFFQRSYARAGELLEGPSLKARALRLLGLDPTLPVAHQTFVIPVREAPRFFSRYAELMAAAPELEKRLELQDIIRPKACQWPLHGAYGIDGGAFLLTISIGVVRKSALEQRARQFFSDLSKHAFAETGAKTLLLKNTHGDLGVLRAMHQPMLECLARVKAEVDPKGLLQNQLFAPLLAPK